MKITEERLQRALDNGHTLEWKCTYQETDWSILHGAPLFDRSHKYRVQVPPSIPEKHHECYRAWAMGGKVRSRRSGENWSDWGVRVDGYSWLDDSDYEYRFSEDKKMTDTNDEWGPWIEWSGGERPVKSDEVVRIMLDDKMEHCGLAYDFEWNATKEGIFKPIIAYQRGKTIIEAGANKGPAKEDAKPLQTPLEIGGVYTLEIGDNGGVAFYDRGELGEKTKIMNFFSDVNGLIEYLKGE